MFVGFWVRILKRHTRLSLDVRSVYCATVGDFYGYRYCLFNIVERFLETEILNSFNETSFSLANIDFYVIFSGHKINK